MAKTRLEKIADYEDQIIQIKKRQKQERQKLSKEERNARTRRLCSRHGLLEKMLPEIITLTDDQYEVFLEKAVLSVTSRRILDGLLTGQNAEAAAIPADIEPGNGATEDEKKKKSEVETPVT
jgi:hypothetical protein